MCSNVGVVIVSALNTVANRSEPLWEEQQTRKCVPRLRRVHGDSLTVNSFLRPLLSWSNKRSYNNNNIQVQNDV